MTITEEPKAEASPVVNGQPEHQQDFLLQFRNKFKLDQNPPPAIDKSVGSVVLPLKGEVKEGKNPYAYDSPLPKVKSAEEIERARKESIAIRQKALQYLADIKKEYPTINGLPEFHYESDYAAGRVQPSTVQKHYDALVAAVQLLIPQAKADMKAMETIASKRADDKVKEIIKEEQEGLEDLDEYNNNIGVPEEDNIDIAPDDRALAQYKQKGGAVEEPIDYVTFGENCYALEHAIVKINLIRQRKNGVDLPSVLPKLEENKPKIEEAYQGLGEKYPKSIVVRILNDPVAKLLSAHAPVIAAGLDDMSENSKKNQLVN